MKGLKAQVSFPSNVASIFSAIKQNSLILFLNQRSCTLFKRSPLKCKVLRFLSAQVKIRRIPHVIFESTSQFSFKCCISNQFHQAKLPYTFFSWKIMYFIQKKPIKMQIFWDFRVLGSKFVKFLLSFLKPQVSFPSDVASIFTAIKQNSPILFLAQRSCTLSKRSP